MQKDKTSLWAHASWGKPAKFVTWSVRIIFHKSDNKLWIISLEKEYFDGKESVRFLCLQTFTRLRLRLLVVYKAKDSWALTRLERLLLLHLTLLPCNSHQIQIVALRFSLNTNCCLAILTKHRAKNPAVDREQSYAYYLLGGKNLCWNVKSDRQEQILECTKKSWQSWPAHFMETLGEGETPCPEHII